MKNLSFYFFVLFFGILAACDTSDFSEVIPISSEHTLKTRATFDSELIQSYGLEEYNNLLSSFKSSPVPSAEPSNYPGYYGGAYVNDNGKLVILISGNPKVHRTEFVRRCGSEDIVLEKCQYPYVKLLNQINRINDYIDKNPNCSILGYALRDKENYIEIYLESMNQTAIAEYRNVFQHSEMIKFSKGERGNPEVSLNPGGLLTRINNPWASVGFRASTGLTKGIVSAGHGYKLGDNVEFEYVSVGVCTKSQQFGTVDAAYCEVTNSNYIPSNTIEFTSYVLSTSTASGAYNTSVTLAGAISGIQVGRITSTSSSQTFNSIRYYDLVETDYNSTGGDSGGLIFITGSNGIIYTGGIHLGVAKNKKYYSKASNVLNALGLTRY